MTVRKENKIRRSLDVLARGLDVLARGLENLVRGLDFLTSGQRTAMWLPCGCPLSYSVMGEMGARVHHIRTVAVKGWRLSRGGWFSFPKCQKWARLAFLQMARWARLLLFPSVKNGHGWEMMQMIIETNVLCDHWNERALWSLKRTCSVLKSW